MAEAGCLKDVAVQNIDASGTISLPVTGVPIVANRDNNNQGMVGVAYAAQTTFAQQGAAGQLAQINVALPVNAVILDVGFRTLTPIATAAGTVTINVAAGAVGITGGAVTVVGNNATVRANENISVLAVNAPNGVTAIGFAANVALRIAAGGNVQFTFTSTAAVLTSNGTSIVQPYVKYMVDA